MFTEFLQSILLIMYIIGIYIHGYYNSDVIPHICSFFIPCVLVLNYYFNACCVQNMYLTFYSYGTSFAKRYKLYKYIGLTLSLISLILCVTTNQNQLVLTTIFSFNYYPLWFIEFLCWLGLIVTIYIIIKLYYIIQRDITYLGNFESPDIYLNNRIYNYN